MRLLDRYLLRELLLPLAYCLLGFLISFIAFDLFSSLGEFQKNNLTAGDIVEYYFDRTPEFLVTSFVVPMSLLLALLYSLTNHARHHELTAMRAAAIPLWRITLPYFVVGLIFSVAVAYVNERLVPDGVEAAAQVMVRHTAGQTSRAVKKIQDPEVNFHNAAANRIWRIAAYHLQNHTMIRPHFEWTHPDGSHMTLDAEGARWFQRRWVFTNATRLAYPAGATQLPDILKTNQLVVPGLTETPRIIRSEIKINSVGDRLRSLRRSQFSSAEILGYLRLHPDLERDRSDFLRTMLHGRLATPWICFVVVLIAVPFGSLPGRRNVFVGVASSVFICFAFFVMKEFALAFGSNGTVPPWFAAWSPNILFSVTGLVLMWRAR